MADPPPSNVGIPQHRINHLANLTDDWDSYGGKPPTDEALRAARSLNTVPTPSGGIQFEWHANGWDVEVEVAPDGTPEFWAHQRESGRTLSAGVAAGPQATPDQPDDERALHIQIGKTLQEHGGWDVGNHAAAGKGLVDLLALGGICVRVVAVPTDHEDRP